MATGSGAFGAKCGFNQSGGGLFLVLVNGGGGILVNQGFEAAVASGSGGSFVQAMPVANAVTVAAGQVLKDMGKTLNIPTSTGRMRTFRKFQVVGNASGDAANFGVNPNGSATGPPGGRPFYLETMREGQEPSGDATPPLIARYF